MEMESMSSTLAGPTIISPVVTRFFWPPDTPRIISLPIRVSEQTWRTECRWGIGFQLASSRVKPSPSDPPSNG